MIFSENSAGGKEGQAVMLPPFTRHILKAQAFNAGSSSSMRRCRQQHLETPDCGSCGEKRSSTADADFDHQRHPAHMSESSKGSAMKLVRNGW
jgi:hypothetical protein